MKGLLVCAVGQKIHRHARAVVALDGRRAFRPTAVLERPVAGRVVVDMRVLPNLEFESE
jgi:hypothetical protein